MEKDLFGQSVPQGAEPLVTGWEELSYYEQPELLPDIPDTQPSLLDEGES